MTDNVYDVLCIITRGREAGATVIELGHQLPHDQKSLFHFVRVLQELGLVEKFRAYAAKTWTNRVVHRRYLATSKHWRDFTSGQVGEDTTAPATNDPPDVVDDGYDENGAVGPADQKDLPTFPPITTHMSSVNSSVIKSRVAAVLRKCRSYTVVHSDLIKHIVCLALPPSLGHC